jgi:hypothetical protein
VFEIRFSLSEKVKRKSSCLGFEFMHIATKLIISQLSTLCVALFGRTRVTDRQTYFSDLLCVLNGVKESSGSQILSVDYKVV